MREWGGRHGAAGSGPSEAGRRPAGRPSNRLRRDDPGGSALVDRRAWWWRDRRWTTPGMLAVLLAMLGVGMLAVLPGLAAAMIEEVVFGAAAAAAVTTAVALRRAWVGRADDDTADYPQFDGQPAVLTGRGTGLHTTTDDAIATVEHGASALAPCICTGGPRTPTPTPRAPSPPGSTRGPGPAAPSGWARRHRQPRMTSTVLTAPAIMALGRYDRRSQPRADCAIRRLRRCTGGGRSRRVLAGRPRGRRAR